MNRQLGDAPPRMLALVHGPMPWRCGKATTHHTCPTTSPMGSSLSRSSGHVLWGRAPASVLALWPSRLIPGDHQYRSALGQQPYAGAHAEATWSH
jgi:hypothetical protein